MASLTPGVERKVRQLDHDVQAIYEMIAGIEATQRRHTNRLDTIDGHLETIDGRLEAVEGRLGEMDSKLDEVLRRLPS